MHCNGFDRMQIARQQANSVTGSPNLVRAENARRDGSARPEDAGCLESAQHEACSAAVDRRRFPLASGDGVAGAIGMNNGRFPKPRLQARLRLPIGCLPIVISTAESKKS